MFWYVVPKFQFVFLRMLGPVVQSIVVTDDGSGNFDVSLMYVGTDEDESEI